MRARLAILSLFGLLACEETFDPRGTKEDRLVLYAILSPATDTVLVRLQATYDPPSSDPLSHRTEPTLTPTSQLLWSGGSAALTDSIIPHPDPIRYTNGMHVLKASPLRVVRGRSYVVQVDAPGFPRAEATTRVPGAAPFSFRNEDVLVHPADYENLDIDLLVDLPVEAYGFWPRLFLEYEVLSTDSVLERVEVPFELATSVDGVEPVYAMLRGASSVGHRTVSSLEVFTYEQDAYRYAIDHVRERYAAGSVRFRRVILYLTIVDEHLYKYYYIVHGFFDPYSVRTDEPDYSNVAGGAGVVGSYTVDSLTISLPP